MPTKPRGAPTRALTKRELQRRDATGHGIRITLDGAEYTVHVGDLSAADTSALRRETGWSFNGLLNAAATDPDIDTVAAIVWLARRINGEPGVSFVAVAQEITYRSDYGAEAVAPTEEATTPVVIDGEVATSPEG